MSRTEASSTPMSRKTFLRRSALVGAALVGGGALQGCGALEEIAGGAGKVPCGPLTIYSPAPTTNPLHQLNLQLLTLFAGSPSLASAVMPSLALPESVNLIAAVDPGRKRTDLPIMTTVDLRPARDGAGLPWHAYAQPQPDLKFVSRLYDVGFAVQLFGRGGEALTPEDVRGKRLGVPARASSVRVMTETLLRDGWGVLDDVTLVDLAPPQVTAARAAGQIDGTTWNLVLPQDGGFAPLLPADPADGPASCVPVDQDALDRVNQANGFQTGLTTPLPDGPPMMSFAQCLAAWDTTDAQVVTAMLEAILEKGASAKGYPRDAAGMATWPLLEPAEVHPAAVAFYERNGVALR